MHPRLKALGTYLGWSLKNQNKECSLEEPNPKNSSKPQSRNSNLYAKRWKLSIYLSSGHLRVKTLTYFDRSFRKHASDFCRLRKKRQEQRTFDGMRKVGRWERCFYFFLEKITYGLGSLENIFIDNYGLYPLRDCKLWAYIHYIIVNYDVSALKS